MRTFEYLDDKSRKFWSIERKGKELTIRFGKIGSAGQTTLKELADEARAQKEHDKLIAEKLGKGYVETTPGAVPVPAPAPAMLASKQPESPPTPAPAIAPVAVAAGPLTFRCQDGTSDKFWNIELQGCSFTVTFGRSGTKGQSKTKSFPSEAKAREEHEKLIREKVAGGYVQTNLATGAGRASSATQQALERVLVENPADLATHMAYADHLHEQGDPRGELIQVQLALEDEGRSPRERKALQERESALLHQHVRGWLGDLAPYLLDQKDVYASYVKAGQGYSFRFARGWLDYVHLFNLNRSTGRALRDNPLLRLLRHLVITNDDDDDPGFEELLESPFLANLRAFQLGPEDDQCHISGEGAASLVEKMPKLEELRLYAHDVPVRILFAMLLPHLRVLHVYHLHDYPLEVLAANRTLGRLTEFKCWPHALEPDDDQAYITFEGARALFHSPHLKSLKHLQLRLTDLGDEGCTELVKSGMLKRLETLDLTGGRITDVGARTLAACPDLKRLKDLKIGNNFLTNDGVKALQAVGVPLEAAQQFTNYDPDEREYLWYGDCE